MPNVAFPNRPIPPPSANTLPPNNAIPLNEAENSKPDEAENDAEANIFGSLAQHLAVPTTQQHMMAHQQPVYEAMLVQPVSDPYPVYM